MSSADMRNAGDLPTLFEGTAAANPALAAVRFGSTVLTFGELDRRANQLAHHLRRLGAGVERIVGVCLPRSPAVPQSLLAVLKAGAAFLSMDPAYPDRSLRSVLDDSGARLLITTTALAGRFADWDGTVVCVDAAAPAWADEPGTAPERGALGEALAYVMYTSGSTGRPKGAAIPHRGPVNYYPYLREDFGLGPGDVVLQLAPLSFDASVRDLLGSLMCGATVLLLADGSQRDADLLIGEIARHGVTAICAMIPALLLRLVAAGERLARVPDTLRLILTSAEPLTTELAGRAQTVFDCRVVNQYGSTECTMSQTRGELAAALPDDVEVPAGRPIPGVRIHILDEGQRPVGPGVDGEIYIGGPGVGRGYWNAPALTAERFLTLRLDDGPPQRVYRTGDRGRVRPDGSCSSAGPTTRSRFAVSGSRPRRSRRPCASTRTWSRPSSSGTGGPTARPSCGPTWSAARRCRPRPAWSRSWPTGSRPTCVRSGFCCWNGCRATIMANSTGPP
jgi:amino acid adenylation domain-containing protein